MLSGLKFQLPPHGITLLLAALAPAWKRTGLLCGSRILILREDLNAFKVASPELSTSTALAGHRGWTRRPPDGRNQEVLTTSETQLRLRLITNWTMSVQTAFKNPTMKAEALKVEKWTTTVGYNQPCWDWSGIERLPQGSFISNGQAASSELRKFGLNRERKTSTDS